MLPIETLSSNFDSINFDFDIHPNDFKTKSRSLYRYAVGGNEKGDIFLFLRNSCRIEIYCYSEIENGYCLFKRQVRPYFYDINTHEINVYRDMEIYACRGKMEAFYSQLEKTGKLSLLFLSNDD